MSQKINLAEKNSKNKIVYEEGRDAKSLALNALWLDPFAPPSALHKKALHEASIELLSVSTLDDLKKVLNDTNLVVIRIKENADLYDEVLELGILDNLDKKILLVEWPNFLEKIIKDPIIFKINFGKTNYERNVIINLPKNFTMIEK